MRARVNGVELDYQVEGDGPPLVWVAGTGVGGGVWRRDQVPCFASDYTCLTFDLRGAGASEAPESGYTVQNMAKDTVDLVQHVFGPMPVPMVGLSLGSAIIQEVAIRHPEIISAAVLVGTWSSTEREHHIRRWFEARRLALVQGPLEVFQAFGFWMWSPTVVDEEPELMAELEDFFKQNSGQQPLHAYDGHFDADLGHDTYDRLATITVPTLVIHGSEDLITLPRYNRTVAGQIPDTRLVEIDGGGHFVWVERGTEVNTAITEFFKEKGL